MFFARIVMPFSRSRSMESRTRSATSWFARKAPVCQSIASTSVVLPWSTCATMATLRRSSRVAMRIRTPKLDGGAGPPSVSARGLGRPIEPAEVTRSYSRLDVGRQEARGDRVLRRTGELRIREPDLVARNPELVGQVDPHEARVVGVEGDRDALAEQPA